MQAKIIQIGNSYGVRLPREYLKRNKLMPGQYIHLPNTQPRTGNLKEVIAQAQAHAKLQETPTSIEEIIALQRAERTTWQTRLDKQGRPSS